MKILLDTHHVLWAAIDPERLTQGEVALLDDIATTAMVSAVSMWELQLKWHSLHRSGDRKGPVDPAELVARLTDARVDFVPLTAAQASARLHQDVPNKDPFDRMLLLQAQEIGARLLTRDTKLQGHPLVVQL